MEFEKAPNPLTRLIVLDTSREISACVSVAITNEDYLCVVAKINLSTPVLSYRCSKRTSDRRRICYEIYCILNMVIGYLFERTCYFVNKYITECICNYRVEGCICLCSRMNVI